MKGSGLVVAKIKDFLNASYDENPPAKIGEYMLDSELSNKYGKVYFSISKKKVVIVFRGTKELSDWSNNLIYGLNVNAYKLSPRYKTAKRMYEKAKKRYKGYTTDLLGHSQGAIPLNFLLNEKTDLDGIALNPAYKLGNLKSNEYIIKSNLDPVSVLHKPKELVNKVLNPTWNSKHITNIPSKNYNLLKQHSIDVLDNLPQDKYIGRLKGGCVNKKYVIESQFPFD